MKEGTITNADNAFTAKLKPTYAAPSLAKRGEPSASNSVQRLTASIRKD
jgi:hypothetical protein